MSLASRSLQIKSLNSAMKWNKYIIGIFVLALVLTGFWMFGPKTQSDAPAVTAPAAELSAALELQESDDDGATISVLPEIVSAKNSEWVFEIVMDTHSIELDNDLLASVTLTAGGAEYLPLRWEGDPPGGHHRSGKLTFKAVDPYPQDLTMTISGIGAPRTFTWQLTGKVELN
jgi:hypothetical protein